MPRLPGRPRIIQDVRTINIDFSASDVEQLDRIAVAKQMSRAELLRRLVRSYAHLISSTAITELPHDPSP